MAGMEPSSSTASRSVFLRSSFVGSFCGLATFGPRQRLSPRVPSLRLCYRALRPPLPKSHAPSISGNTDRGMATTKSEVGLELHQPEPIQMPSTIVSQTSQPSMHRSSWRQIRLFVLLGTCQRTTRIPARAPATAMTRPTPRSEYKLAGSPMPTRATTARTVAAVMSGMSRIYLAA
jgi:hypothetical protein